MLTVFMKFNCVIVVRGSMTDQSEDEFNHDDLVENKVSKVISQYTMHQCL